MYPEEMVAPIRADLTDVGFTELTTSEEVVDHFEKINGTALLVINSICGCAAGMARPAVKMALTNASKQPAHLFTVFAGVDMDATSKAREYTLPYPPSSPSIALFKDFELNSRLFISSTRKFGSINLGSNILLIKNSVWG